MLVLSPHAEPVHLTGVEGVGTPGILEELGIVTCEGLGMVQTHWLELVSLQHQAYSPAVEIGVTLHKGETDPSPVGHKMNQILWVGLQRALEPGGPSLRALVILCRAQQACPSSHCMTGTLLRAETLSGREPRMGERRPCHPSEHQFFRPLLEGSGSVSVNSARYYLRNSVERHPLLHCVSPPLKEYKRDAPCFLLRQFPVIQPVWKEWHYILFRFLL